ncbi:MAG: hypothetical protein KBH45_04805 [Verrucomicrobia bacterium]|nr:hypothetical protein [Verrucomicrobiota bacterium]
MKSKLLVSLVVIMALVIGFFLGRWQVTHTLDHYIATLSMPEARRAMADFSKAAGLLKAIRSGETNQAIATLEDDLDTQILFIGGITEATPIAERDKQWLSRIRWLRDYRAEYPRKTESPVLDEQVAQVLSLVHTNR